MNSGLLTGALTAVILAALGRIVAAVVVAVVTIAVVVTVLVLLRRDVRRLGGAAHEISAGRSTAHASSSPLMR